MATLYIATDNGLAALTPDDSGYQCDLHLTDHEAQCVAVDPLRPELIYSGTFGGGLWRSDDCGQNWRPPGEGTMHSKVLSVAVSRLERVDDHGVVYAGTEPSGVFRSKDGGDSWRKCTGLNELPSSSEWSFPPRPKTHHARWIHPDPHQTGRLFVAIEAGALIRSSDGGRTWTDRVRTGPLDTHQMAMHLSIPGRLYSAAGDGYFESVDGGETWKAIEDGLEHRYVWSVAVDPGAPDTRIISSAASAGRSHNNDGAESFIYRRTKDSQWQQITDGLPASTGRRTAMLATHPTEQGTFFAIWETDLFRSTDGGASWQQLDVPWPEGFQVGEARGLAIASSGENAT